MLLRPRQKIFVKRVVQALNEYKNTLGVAPTGAGKTVMLSAAVGELGGTSLILQHRDELVEQNERTFRKVNPTVPTSLMVADYKRWARGGTTFAMIQTLQRDNNLKTMPPVDNVVVDEGHHAVADGYLKVIHHAKELNPDVKLLLVSATPGRADRRNLRALVDNVADQITLGELIREGHLVRPRALVIDTGIQEELDGLKRKRFDEFDQAEVERIMNKRVINDKVVAEWQKHASDRQTVVFCSTIQHATDVLDAFRRAGVSAEMVSGDDPNRDEKLKDYDAGKFQVIINVAVLTEGWDCQPVSCVVLLRKESYKGTVIQMVGRGLRKLDPERYPGRTKDDCLVMDFGYSLHTHRGLEQVIRIENQEAPKACPECAAMVPSCLFECPICGYTWPMSATEKVQLAADSESAEPGFLSDFTMTEVDLLEQSPYRWEDLFDGLVTIANAIDAWACVLNFQGRWIAIGGAKEQGMQIVADSDSRLLALAEADDFLREHGDEDSANKQSRWLHQPATEKQTQHLGMNPMAGLGVSRYRASCLLTWRFNERGIKAKVMNRGMKAAA